MPRSAIVSAARNAGAGTINVLNASALNVPMPFVASVSRNGYRVTRLTVTGFDPIGSTVSVGGVAGTPDQNLYPGDILVGEAGNLALDNITLGSHAGPISIWPYSSNVTLDFGMTDWHMIVLEGNVALAAVNIAQSQGFSLVLVQGTGGGFLVSSWFPGIRWPGGATPTLTTTAGAIDVFTFKNLSPGVHLGFTCGQNM